VQKKHRPQLVVNGLATRSPGLIDVTLLPV